MQNKVHLYIHTNKLVPDFILKIKQNCKCVTIYCCWKPLSSPIHVQQWIKYINWRMVILTKYTAY